MKNAFEVFDFKDEGDHPEFANKLLSKLKNSTNNDSPFHKYQFRENEASVDVRSSEVEEKEIHNLSCPDVGAKQCTHIHQKYSSDREGIFTEQGEFNVVKVAEMNLLGCLPDQCSEIDTRELFSLRAVCTEAATAPSEEKTQTHRALSDIPSSADNSESSEKKSEADESSNESSPYSPLSQNGGSVKGHGQSSANRFGHVKTDGVSVAVDYIVYQCHYHTSCLVTFASSGIKVKFFTALETQEQCSLERGIDVITYIESRYLQKFGTVLVKLHMLLTEEVQADSPNGPSGVEELEFAVLEPNWLLKWEQITSLNTKYSTIWRNVNGMDVAVDGRDHQPRPYFPNFDEAFEDVIYPKGDSDAVSISKRDVDLLQPETFVNDNIIDFYINYLKIQIPSDERHKFHFFNSFFFRKLADLDKDPSSASDGRAAFLRVHKWTRKVDLFAKDFVFIPVNFNLHWSLLVICYPGEVADSEEERIEKAKFFRVPCILHMDSIKGTHSNLKNLVQSYLWEEWKVWHKETPEDVSSKFMNLRFVSLELPQQENSYDCGLFLLHYLELFLAEAPVDFSPFKMNKFSKFLTVDWFTPAEASLKRTLIQRIISDLIVSSCGVSSSDRSDESLCYFQESNGKETAAEFVSKGGISADNCGGNLPGAEAAQGIEITLLEAAGTRDSQCINDPTLVLGELFEPGVSGAGPLLGECSTFDRTSSYCGMNNTMPQMEDGAVAGEQFGYFPSGEPVYSEANGLAPQASLPCSFRSFVPGASWNPGIPMRGGDNGTSTESSVSNDSDVGIIENCSVVRDAVLSREQKIGLEGNSPLETAVYFTDTVASASVEMVGSSAVEIRYRTDNMGNDLQNGELASYQENTGTMSDDDANVEANGMDQDMKPEVNEFEVPGTIDDPVAESHEKPPLKRLRLSPVLGEGSFSQSLPEDFQL